MLAIIRRASPSQQMGNSGSVFPTASASSIRTTFPSTSSRHRCKSRRSPPTARSTGKIYRAMAPSNPHLPPLVRELEIDYTALSLVAPEKVSFRYKLEGWDQDWQDAGTRRQAFYSNLPPRNYTFRVKACNNSGLWNEAGTSLDFSIAPAYYQTYWFRLSCFAAFIALLCVTPSMAIRQLKGQEKRLRDVVETIPAMTFTALSDGSSTFVNKRWTEYTGLSVEQSSGAGWQPCDPSRRSCAPFREVAHLRCDRPAFRRRGALPSLR